MNEDSGEVDLSTSVLSWESRAYLYDYFEKAS